MDSQGIRRRFLARMRPDASFALLDRLPDVAAFIKDRERRFVLCNRALVRLLGKRHESEVIGRSDEDFSPKHLCEKYAADDERVLSTGRPLIDLVEAVRNPDGSIDWYNTSKLAIIGRDGAVIGVAGITRDLRKMGSTSERFLMMAPVIETMLTDFAKPLTMSALAAKLELSVSQFVRQFKKRFGITPLKYLIQVRINAACEQLITTDLALSRIALDTGFYDQSHFTHQFARLKGMPPSRYRAIYDARRPADVDFPQLPRRSGRE